ncbi:MAG TPA: hypothetical protein VJ772_02965 [Nitrososphaeraceae archaeon]|nr:hypothetical protein [Nitrososphaeraceae archaeon]
MTTVNCPQLGEPIRAMAILSIILILLTFWPWSHFGNSLYFGDDLILTSSTNSSTFMQGGLAETEKGDVYVVWVDGNSVYFRSSQDYGVKFGNPVLLSNANVSLSPQTGPKISGTEKGDVYVVWVDGNSVYFRSSQDYGVKFGNPIRLSNEARIASSPQIAATEKGDVYVVWADQNTASGDIDVILKRSSNNGMEFGSSDRLSRKNDILSLSPQIDGTERGDVFFVRIDKNNMTGESEIIFRSSSKMGEDFNSNIPLDRDPGDFTVSVSPDLAGTERGDVYVAWSENNIQFKEILGNGTWFSETVTINNISSLGFSPQVAATEKGDVYLLWVNQINGTETKDLLFKRISHEILE